MIDSCLSIGLGITKLCYGGGLIKKFHRARPDGADGSICLPNLWHDEAGIKAA